MLDISITYVGYNRDETKCRIACNLGILLMNNNCFAIYFQQHSSYVCSDIYINNILGYSIADISNNKGEVLVTLYQKYSGSCTNLISVILKCAVT